MSGNRVIGYKGHLPWKNRNDMQFFKAMTWEQDVIMGRSTFESVGILKNRHHWVLTNNKLNTAIFDGLTEKEIVNYVTLDQIDISSNNKSWVCGGESIYKQLLPACTDLYLSVIPEEYEGDSYMPEFEGYFPEQRLICEFKDLFIIHCWRVTTIHEEFYREGFDDKLIGNYEVDYCPDPRGDENKDPYVYYWKKGWNDAPKIDWK